MFSHLTSLGSVWFLPISARLALPSWQERSVRSDPSTSITSRAAVTSSSSSGYLGLQPGV